MNITLEGGQMTNPDSEELGWWVDGRVITIRTDVFTTVYKLPRCSVVTIIRLGGERARLGLGGFTKTTVSITGPRRTLEQLREAVL